MGSQAATWILGAIGTALLFTVLPVLRSWSTYFEVFVHESGHAIAALLTGKSVTALEVMRGGGGCVLTDGNGGWFATVTTALAGYLAPPAVGLGLVAALHYGVSPRTLLLIVLAIPVTMLLLAASTFTIAVIVLVLAAIAVLIHQAGPVSQATALVIAATILLFGGLRSSLGLVRFEGGGTDVQHLTARTGLPAAFWIVAFVAFAGYAIFLSGQWLLTEPLAIAQ